MCKMVSLGLRSYMPASFLSRRVAEVYPEGQWSSDQSVAFEVGAEHLCSRDVLAQHLFKTEYPCGRRVGLGLAGRQTSGSVQEGVRTPSLRNQTSEGQL